MLNKILKVLFIFICIFFIVGCDDENDNLSKLDPELNDLPINNKDEEDEQILTIEYEEIMYYGQELIFKVTSKYDNDEINIVSLNEDVVFLILSDTNEHIIVGYDLGVADIKITSKYGEEVIVQVTVDAKEGFAPPIENMAIYIRESGPYYVNEVYHIDYVVDAEIYNDSFRFFASPHYKIDLDKMEIIFKRSGTIEVTSITFKNAVKASIIVDVQFNPNIEMYDILFIGNSFTYFFDIPNIIVSMIESDGVYVKYSQDTVGGSYLIDHKDAFNKLINEVNYTHIILQEQSFGPIRYFDKFKNAVLYYDELIKENGAELVLYQTWGYNTDNYQGYDKYSMAAALKDAYQTLANETNSLISRVGDAFVMYETEYTDLPTLYHDMSHQSIYGAYLSACVHYATITGRRASDNDYILEDIDSDLIKIIQEIADKIVFPEA